MTAIFTELSDDYDAKELARLQAEEERLYKRMQAIQAENRGKIDELRKQIEDANKDWSKAYVQLHYPPKTNTKEKTE